MIVKINGKYTKEFINAFCDAYGQPDINIFMTFCQENHLINDDVIDLIELGYGERFLNEVLNVNN